MRRYSTLCALVALALVWNHTAVRAAERIETVTEGDLLSAERLLGTGDGGFLSFVSHHEYEDTEWCDDCCYDCAPRWTVWAGAIFLQRDSPGRQTLVASGGTSLLNADQLNFGTQGGPDINAIRHGEMFDIGFRYFHVNQMTARNRVFPFGGTGTIQLDVPFAFTSPTIDAVYTTSIQSVEINLRRNVTPGLALLAGFRYISLRDDLAHIFALGPLTGRVNVNGINRLYGGQIGADANVWTAGRFQLQTALKAGVYGNGSNNALRFHNGLFETSISRNAGQVAFLGDWNFSGIVQITDVWAFRAGYQLLWLSGLALASEQYPVLPGNFLPTASVISTGDLFLHGALVSIQAGW